MDENNQLTNKSELFVNMRDYYKGIGQNPYSVLPVTYMISNTNDPEFKQFEQYYHATRNKITEIKRLLDAELQNYYKKRANDGKTKSKRKRIENEYGDESEYDLYEDDEEVKAIRKKYKVPCNTWIVKPGEDTNRGKGINVASEFHEIKSLTAQTCNGHSDTTAIIQKYIDNPFLIHKRKFDFRVYALVTSINQKLKAYFYEDGYIRTSS